MHARIEQDATDKSIFCQEEWVDLMKSAKKTGEPYTVKEIQQQDIMNFEGLANMFNWPTVKVASIKQILFKPNDPNFYIKYEFRDENWKKRNFLKRKFNLQSVKNFKLEPLYIKKFSLPEEKKKDITDMMRRNLIPKKYHKKWVDLLNM